MNRIVNIPENSSIKKIVLQSIEDKPITIPGISTLPKEPAVFLICSRLSGQTANPRYVGSSMNLHDTIQNIDKINFPFYIINFLKSLSTKEIIYQVLEGFDEKSLLEKVEKWKSIFKPSIPNNQLMGDNFITNEMIFPIEEQIHYLPTHKQLGKVLISMLKSRCTNDLLKRELGAFNLSKHFMFPNLDRIRLENAFRRLLLRHESLRTIFIVSKGEVRQMIKDIDDINTQILNLQARNKQELEGMISSLNKVDFDFFKDLPTKLATIKRPDGHFSVILVINHIVCDFDSMTILQEDFINFYENTYHGNPNDNKSIPVQLKDYAVWESHMINNNTYRHFWNEKLKGILPISLLKNYFCSSTEEKMSLLSYYETLKEEAKSNFQKIKSHEISRVAGIGHRLSSFRGASYRFVVYKKNYDDLKKIAASTGATTYHVIVSALFMLVSKISQKEDIILGVECNIRNSKLRRTVGWLSNTILLRQLVDPEIHVSEFIDRCSKEIIESMNYCAYPIEKVLFEIDRSIDSFGSLHINYQNLSNVNSVIIENFESFHLKDGIPYFDLDLVINEYSNGIDVLIRYKEELFEQEKIECFGRQFIDALVFMSTAGKKNISDFMINCQPKSNNT